LDKQEVRKSSFNWWGWSLSMTVIILTLMMNVPLCSGADKFDVIDKMAIQNQIMSYIRNAYVDTISSKSLFDGAIQGIFDKLDPHSTYMLPDTAKDFTEKIQGDFEGIGITFAVIDSEITVMEVVEGGPSDFAGLKTRDKILKINGDDVIGISDDSVKVLMRGPKGTKVVVNVAHPGESAQREVTIIRGEIEVSSISHAYMLDQTTGYIVLTRFSYKTTQEVRTMLSRMKSQGMKRLVLDLRNNSGGWLEAAKGVVDCFISDGLIVETKGRRSRDNKKWFASGKASYSDIPLIVIINHGSASASEIVAGALQDHDRALVVGQTSFGKGLVMDQLPLRYQNGKDLGTLLLSVARYYTPSGRLIQRPYQEETREEYIKEGYDDVDPNAQDSTKAGKPVFFTDLGRQVYGGGGITPDVYIKPIPRLNKLEIELRRTNLFFEFADRYLLQHDNIPQAFDEFLSDYHIPQRELAQYKDFVKAKGISIDDGTQVRNELKKIITTYGLPEEAMASFDQTLSAVGVDDIDILFDRSTHFIERELKQEIARMVWGPTERFKVWHTDDSELHEALTYFSEAEILLEKRIALQKSHTEPSHSE
jgi:carboxyl-terminal processing protease